MNYLNKLAQLEVMRDSKSLEFERAFAHYSVKGQNLISFNEVSQLKDELFELEALIYVLKSLKETNSFLEGV